MASIQRPLSGDLLLFELGEERERAADREIVERSGRNARTLLKNGPLRVTLVVLGAGGALAEHQAPGPITVQVLDGTIRFSASGVTHELGPGQLLSAGAGVRHAVESAAGAAFLLTVCQTSRDA